MRQHHPRNIPFGANNFLSVLEGIEGGFAVFVGIVAGLYVQNVSQELLVTTGIIGVIVSAFNASAVRYASEHYTDELDGHEKRHKFQAYLVPALVEFLTYTLVSLIVVIPLLLIQETSVAILLTIGLTLVILFLAGAYRGKMLGRHLVRDGVELAGIGISIIIVGALAGSLLAYLIQ